jgi:hypothetical protein
MYGSIMVCFFVARVACRQGRKGGGHKVGEMVCPYNGTHALITATGPPEK